jgi:hypothetical protein
MTGTSLATRIKDEAGYPNITTCLQDYAQAIVDHIQNDGKVEFTSGTIIGTCTNTLLSPGSLTAGEGADGKVINLDGPTLAQLIADSCFGGSVSQKLLDKSTAMVDYIMDEAISEYASGNVTGDCPAGGGSLQNGAGVDGIIQ